MRALFLKNIYVAVPALRHPGYFSARKVSLHLRTRRVVCNYPPPANFPKTICLGLSWFVVSVNRCRGGDCPVAGRRVGGGPRGARAPAAGGRRRKGRARAISIVFSICVPAILQSKNMVLLFNIFNFAALKIGLPHFSNCVDWIQIWTPHCTPQVILAKPSRYQEDLTICFVS